MVRKKPLIILCLLIGLNLYAQSKFGIGIDFIGYPELEIENYPEPLYKVNATKHYTFLPSIHYNFSNNSSIGILMGFGQGYSAITSGTGQEFTSESVEAGIYYNRTLYTLKRWSVFVQSSIVYRINMQKISSGNIIYIGKAILSWNFNMRSGIKFKITEKLNVSAYAANDLIAWADIKTETPKTYYWNSNWYYAKNTMFGLGLSYRFGKG
jgi:hypothetical protein